LRKYGLRRQTLSLFILETTAGQDLFYFALTNAWIQVIVACKEKIVPRILSSGVAALI
jgi:hypothetical protein